MFPLSKTASFLIHLENKLLWFWRHWLRVWEAWNRAQWLWFPGNGWDPGEVTGLIGLGKQSFSFLVKPLKMSGTHDWHLHTYTEYLQNASVLPKPISHFCSAFGLSCNQSECFSQSIAFTVWALYFCQLQLPPPPDSLSISSCQTLTIHQVWSQAPLSSESYFCLPSGTLPHIAIPVCPLSICYSEGIKIIFTKVWESNFSHKKISNFTKTWNMYSFIQSTF